MDLIHIFWLILQKDAFMGKYLHPKFKNGGSKHLPTCLCDNWFKLISRLYDIFIYGKIICKICEAFFYSLQPGKLKPMHHDYIINFKTILMTRFRTELVFRQSLMYHKIQTILQIIKNI